MHGVHRPFSVHHAQKQNPPPLQLPDEEMKPALMTGSTPRPAISPALGPISQTTLPLPPGICQALLYKLNPSANPPQSPSHHPLGELCLHLLHLGTASIPARDSPVPEAGDPSNVTAHPDAAFTRFRSSTRHLPAVNCSELPGHLRFLPCGCSRNCSLSPPVRCGGEEPDSRSHLGPGNDRNCREERRQQLLRSKTLRMA